MKSFIILYWSILLHISSHSNTQATQGDKAHHRGIHQHIHGIAQEVRPNEYCIFRTTRVLTPHDGHIGRNT
jgi:hypothetical protein